MVKSLKLISVFVSTILLFCSFTYKTTNLKMSAENYPRVDGSTATIPLAISLRSAITGESIEDLQLKTIHTKTTESFRALQYGDADLLIVYTPSDSVLKELKEAGVEIIMEPIGRDALVLFTNESNRVNNLTQKQAQRIYTGQITNWKTVGGINSSILPFQRDAESGSQVMMEKLVMEGKKMMTPKKDFMIFDMGEIIEKVSSYKNDRNALGYSVYYYVRAFLNEDYKIKLLRANGVMPSNKTIKDGTYPYVQDFYAVIRADEPEDSNARKLFNFLLSAEGKKLINDTGYVDLD